MAMMQGGTTPGEKPALGPKDPPAKKSVVGM
jgi:hypothetical protein